MGKNIEAIKEFLPTYYEMRALSESCDTRELDEHPASWTEYYIHQLGALSEQRGTASINQKTIVVSDRVREEIVEFGQKREPVVDNLLELLQTHQNTILKLVKPEIKKPLTEMISLSRKFKRVKPITSSLSVPSLPYHAELAAYPKKESKEPWLVTGLSYNTEKCDRMLLRLDPATAPSRVKIAEMHLMDLWDVLKAEDLALYIIELLKRTRTRIAPVEEYNESVLSKIKEVAAPFVVVDGRR